MEIIGNKKPLRKDHFNTDVVGNEMILYFPDGNQFLYLNQTAAMVWEQCNGTLCVEEIIIGLEEAFPNSDAQIRNDVQATIRTFYQNGCIVLA